MSITKTITTERGDDISYHRVQRVSISPGDDGIHHISCMVFSWPSIAAYQAGAEPRDRSARTLATLPPMDAGFVGSLEALLVTSDGPLLGGVVNADPVDTPLEKARAAKLAELRTIRSLKIAAPKTTAFGAFDADEKSQNDLNKVVSLQAAAASLGLPTAANFTLADNTRRSFTQAELAQAALEIGAQVQAMYDVHDALRAQVVAAQSVGEVAAVVWP